MNASRSFGCGCRRAAAKVGPAFPPMHDLNEITVVTERAQVVLDPAKASVNALTEATADAGYPSHVKEVQ